MELHPCSETPSVRGAEDVDCLDRLAAAYTFIHRVGDAESVSQSLVFKLAQRGGEVAVKVVPLRKKEDAEDVRIACILNGIQEEESPIFVRTFGWLKCGSVPTRWMQGEAPPVFAKRSKMFLFQVMAFSSHSWGDERIRLAREEYRALLFLLMHGLWLARKRYGFRHNDIHAGQVLFQTCKPDTPITVRIHENAYTVVCERFVPKLIDFGFATLGEEEEGEEEEDELFGGGGERMDEDLRNLLYMFEQRMEREGVEAFRVTHRTMEDILLQDAVFRQFRTQSAPIRGRWCDVCSSPATKEWEGCGIRFCDAACADQWSEISKFI